MKQQNIMKRSFFVNFFLIILKLLSGFFFGSLALIADGIHSISDLLSDIFVILGIRHSQKPADEDHPFGHGKFEYVLSLFLGLSVTFIAYNLGYSVVTNFNVEPTIPQTITLVIVVLVIVIKLILAQYLINEGNKIDSEIIRASGKESMSDVISSAVVLIGIISMLLGRITNQSWLLYGDKVASIIIALFIIRIGITIIIDAVKHLQGTTVKKEICEEYEKLILSIEGVVSVDSLDMISYGPYYQAIIEIKVKGSITVREGHDIAHEVEEIMLKSEKICHVSVHVNPED